MDRVPCNPTPDCKYYESGRCREDTDHFYYPANQYTTPVERRFRDLPENKREICRTLHEERHATELPPPKPDLEVMEDALVASGVFLSIRVRRLLYGAA